MKSLNPTGRRNTFLPYILFPMLVGVLTGIVIFLFEIAALAVMRASDCIYAFVRENPIYIPLLILGAIAIGALAALILKIARECRGGGIPTAVAAIRGLIPLKWVQGIFVLFGSTLLTFFVGVPLGNEGPSVQMGTAVGEGSAYVTGKKKMAWERYFMTGGASAGFAIATGAPLSGIMFAFEEAHRRFSPRLFAVASVSVIFGTVTQRYLAFFFGVHHALFDIKIDNVMPMRYLWAAIIIGAVCGVCSLAFTRLYRIVKYLSATRAGKMPLAAKIILIFAVSAVLGVISADFIGTGKSLIEGILNGRTVWYAVLLAFFVRAILMICANNEGVSGGIFVPNLAFGAMIASLISEGLIAAGLVDGQYFAVLIVVGMASFLAAASRTPLTAAIFSAEVLCIASNIIPAICGVVISYIIAEASGKLSFADTVIEARAEAAHRGKKPLIVECKMTVQKSSFADGMEVREILWPPTCTVLSIDKNPVHAAHGDLHCLEEGDVLHLHYRTYDPDHTVKNLISILGEQPKDISASVELGSEDRLVPED